MRHALAVVAAAVLLGLPSQAGAQATKSVEPFNLATVDIAGREAVALVLREQYRRRTRRRQPEPRDDRELPGGRRPGQHGRSDRPVRVRAEAPDLRDRQSRRRPRDSSRAPSGRPTSTTRATSASSRRSGIRARC